jgi:hypothetical protein
VTVDAKSEGAAFVFPTCAPQKMLKVPIADP